MTRYRFVPARPDYPVASVAYFSTAALSFADAITRKLISEIAGIPDAGSRRLAGLQ